MVVVGVKHVYQQLGQVLFLYSFLVVSLIEGVQTEGIHRLGIPDTQGVYHVISIAYDGQVIGDRAHALVSLLHEMSLALFIHLYVHISAEFDDLRVLGAAQLKGIAVFQPVVGNLDLIALLNLLLEHTVMVADSAAVGRIAQGSQRIQETGCQSSQTAVSKSCVGLLIFDQVQVAAQLLQSFLYFIIISQVNQVIAQGASHQEFHGHIVHNLRVLLLHLLLSGQPCVNNRILGRQSHRVEDVAG